MAVATSAPLLGAVEIRQSGRSAAPVAAKGQQSRRHRQKARDSASASRSKLAEAAHDLLQRDLAVGHRGRKAFQPESGQRRAVDMAGDAQGHGRRQMRRARHVAGRSHGRRHGGDSGLIVEPEHQQSLFGFRLGQGLDRHLGHGRERAPGAGHQLAKVIAGDVLHDAPAGLDRLAAPGHRREAEEVIAGSACPNAAWAGKVRCQHAADGALPRRPAEHRAAVDRLEGEHLPLRCNQRLDLGDRRTRTGGQHQFLRLVERDADKARRDRA